MSAFLFMRYKNDVNKLGIIIIILQPLFLLSNCSNPQVSNFGTPEGMVFIEGGNFSSQKLNFHHSNILISDFYLGKYEITQKEWIDVMGTNPSRFKSENHPVEMISWYDAVVYCNRRSLKEGLIPFYQIDSLHLDEVNSSIYDSIKWTVNINSKAKGYRLPTELEWVYAASGGKNSKNFTFSGGNSVDEVAWYWKNSGDQRQSGYWNYEAVEGNNTKTHKIGSKKPNELGLYDMSGNVYELCQDWYEEEQFPLGEARVIKGGSWSAVELTCELEFRHFFVANNKSGDVGLRVCRSK